VKRKKKSNLAKKIGELYYICILYPEAVSACRDIAEFLD